MWATQLHLEAPTDREYSFTASAEKEVTLDVTEKLSFYSVDYDTELTAIGLTLPSHGIVAQPCYSPNEPRLSPNDILTA